MINISDVKSPSLFFPNLNGLRFVAAFAVIIHHVEQTKFLAGIPNSFMNPSILLFGNVLDFACGCGYGSFLLSSNPDVSKVVGVDKDQVSVDWAREHYQTDKCSFLCEDVADVQEPFDTLVSLETIEHFENDELYRKVISNCGIKQVILSYPNKKSTHFNPFHVRDLNKQAVCSSFGDFILYHSFNMGDVDFLLFIKAPGHMPSHIYQNITDFR